MNVLVSFATAYSGDVSVFGVDGTAGEVCRLLELMQERLVHWHVCQLHANEVNLRKLFQHFDGKTTGTNSFSRPLQQR